MVLGPEDDLAGGDAERVGFVGFECGARSRGVLHPDGQDGIGRLEILADRNACFCFKTVEGSAGGCFENGVMRAAEGGGEVFGDGEGAGAGGNV